MAVLVETEPALERAVAQTPEMLAEVVGLPPLGPQDPRDRAVLEGQRSYLTDTLQGLVAAADDISDDPAQHGRLLKRRLELEQWRDQAALEDVIDRQAAGSKATWRRRLHPPHTLAAWVTAAANSAHHKEAGGREGRVRAREWAQYRDALAPAAMAEWNVLVRRWAETTGRSKSNAWAEHLPTPARPEPVVAPVVLNL